MPKTLRSRPRRDLVAGLAAMAMLASACGADSDEAVTTAEDGGQAPAAQSSTTDSSTSGGEADSGDDAASPDAATGQNNFPDVDVINIVDGADVNLAAELGGGDLPVLLWFWAPH